MKNKKLIVLISCLWCLLGSSRLVCNQLEVEKELHLPHVHGAVYDKAGKPVAGAKVELVRDDRVVFETTTDKSGAFKFKDANGLFLLRVLDGRFASAEREVQVGFELAYAAQNRNLFVLLGPSACADSCSTITTSKKEFEQIVRRNARR
jgi:hypothetical protein